MGDTYQVKFRMSNMLLLATSFGCIFLTVCLNTKTCYIVDIFELLCICCPNIFQASPLVEQVVSSSDRGEGLVVWWCTREHATTCQMASTAGSG